MVRKPTTPGQATPQAANLSLEQMQRGVERLRKRLSDVERFQLSTVRKERSPELQALETSIEETLARVFGQGTQEYNRYLGAATVEPLRMVFGGHELSPQEVQNRIAPGLARASATLGQAIRGLEEEIDERNATPPAELNHALEASKSRRVFVVHGRDEGPRESVARFLERLGFVPIILHEQANQGRTVIEKIEDHSDVGFAVVILTPDDEGALKGEPLQPRARQNVLLELGYFLGKLTRKRVCTLKAGELEIPSDWRGVVDEPFDVAGGWRQTLARELDAAGYVVDWNKVMRP